MKKTISLLLVLIMVLSLAACGSTKAPESTPEPTPESTREPAPEPKAEKDRVYVKGHNDFPSPESLQNVTYDHVEDRGELVYKLPKNSDDAITTIQLYLLLLMECDYDWEATSTDQLLLVSMKSTPVAYVGWYEESGSNYMILSFFS